MLNSNLGPDLPAGNSPRRVRNLLAPILVLVVVLLAYGAILVGLFKDWVRDPNYNHGFLIPLVSGYFVWKGRKDLRSATPSPSLFGLAGILAAAALLILGTAGAEVFTQRVSLIVLIASLVLFLYGRHHLRVLAFPIAFLLLAIPMPYVVYYGLTAPMQALAARLALWGLNAFGVQAFAQGNVIHLPQGSLEVAEACSGIRSLYAFLAIGAVAAQLTSIPQWGRLIVFLTTIPLAAAGNAVRVWGSGMGLYVIGPEATKGPIHEFFGLFVFVVSLGVFILLRRVARNVWSSAGSSPLSSSDSPEPMPRSAARTGPRPRRHLNSNEYPKS